MIRYFFSLICGGCGFRNRNFIHILQPPESIFTGGGDDMEHGVPYHIRKRKGSK